jgi:hypothetical protein
VRPGQIERRPTEVSGAARVQKVFPIAPDAGGIDTRGERRDRVASARLSRRYLFESNPRSATVAGKGAVAGPIRSVAVTTAVRLAQSLAVQHPCRLTWWIQPSTKCRRRRPGCRSRRSRPASPLPLGRLQPASRSRAGALVAVQRSGRDAARLQGLRRPGVGQRLRCDARTEVELLDGAAHKRDVLGHLDVVHAPGASRNDLQVAGEGCL